MQGDKSRTQARPGTLSPDEVRELKGLGEGIRISLRCNENAGLPCRTDRLEAVKLMRRYVEIHDG